MTLKEKICEPFDGLKKETADKLVKISDDYAIEFAEWCFKYDRKNPSHTLLTTKMLEIFKKEKEL
jgi:hypothetical protein